MLVISDTLYAAFRKDSFYSFLVVFLDKNSRSPVFKSWLRDGDRCRVAWHGLFDPNCEKMELALRHAYALGCAVAEEAVDERFPDRMPTRVMKARLDCWGFVPFSAFDLGIC